MLGEVSESREVEGYNELIKKYFKDYVLRMASSRWINNIKKILGSC